MAYNSIRESAPTQIAYNQVPKAALHATPAIKQIRMESANSMMLIVPHIVKDFVFLVTMDIILISREFALYCLVIVSLLMLLKLIHASSVMMALL